MRHDTNHQFAVLLLLNMPRQDNGESESGGSEPGWALEEDEHGTDNGMVQGSHLELPTMKLSS